MYWPKRCRGLGTTQYVLMHSCEAYWIDRYRIAGDNTQTHYPGNMHWARATGAYCEDETVLVDPRVKVFHLQYAFSLSLGSVLMTQYICMMLVLQCCSRRRILCIVLFEV